VFSSLVGNHLYRLLACRRVEPDIYGKIWTKSDTKATAGAAIRIRRHGDFLTIHGEDPFGADGDADVAALAPISSDVDSRYPTPPGLYRFLGWMVL
jgi:hypothetical protein